MRLCLGLAVAASAAAMLGAGAPSAAAGVLVVPAVGAAVPAAGLVGKAIEVPGLAALNKGGDASVTTISCASAGNCAAGGDYAEHHHFRDEGFVVVERSGRWAKAIEVPGLEALNTGEDAEVNSVFCASAGNCAVGGDYSLAHSQQGFVADERNGSWGTAVEVPGLGALNKGGQAEVDSVSCGSAGNCVAGGFYSSGQISERGFVTVERNGRWGTAVEVPGLAALDKDRYSAANSVSCASAGNCLVGGYYTYHGGDEGAFAAVERNGVWADAIAVPGLATLDKGHGSGVGSVSCAPAGTCTASGGYTGRGGTTEGFVAAERNGRWGTAIPVPGLAALNEGGAGILSVSCGSAGSCAAGGSYSRMVTSVDRVHGFVAVERNGGWGTAIPVPGLAALNKGARDTEVVTVSCARAGSCVAGGYYYDRHDHHSWFVVTERSGRWGTAIEVPGLAGLNKGSDGVDVSGNGLSVSCAPGGVCAAGGYYVGTSGGDQGFVTQAG